MYLFINKLKIKSIKICKHVQSSTMSKIYQQMHRLNYSNYKNNIRTAAAAATLRTKATTITTATKLQKHNTNENTKVLLTDNYKIYYKELQLHDRNIYKTATIYKKNGQIFCTNMS